MDVHDFPDPKLGKAIPYGVFDLAADAGFVTVGSDGDTAEFAVASIGRWWDKVGSLAYPNATRLMITADAGGSNGYRSWLSGPGSPSPYVTSRPARANGIALNIGFFLISR